MKQVIYNVTITWIKKFSTASEVHCTMYNLYIQFVPCVQRTSSSVLMSLTGFITLRYVQQFAYIYQQLKCMDSCYSDTSTTYVHDIVQCYIGKDEEFEVVVLQFCTQCHLNREENRTNCTMLTFVHSICTVTVQCFV